MRSIGIAGAWLLCTACSAWAVVPDAEVESVQMPAWIERSGQRSPLEAGGQLRNGDRILTGHGARALLRLGEGSMVKLGENASFQLSNLQRPGTKSGVFKATLSVLEGAFRFTTAAVYKFSARREVDVRFRTVTAGIRGTDLWGKSLIDRDIVCLIEGNITVHRSGEGEVRMQQPQTVYQAPVSSAPAAVTPVDPAQLAAWAAETEITPGAGAASKNGRWSVFLGSAPHGDDLAELFSRVAEAGYPARITKLLAEGKPVYWLYLGSLPDRAEAHVLAERLKLEFQLPSVSIAIQ
jgi:cell division septation protein DedD